MSETFVFPFESGSACVCVCVCVHACVCVHEQLGREIAVPRGVPRVRKKSVRELRICINLQNYPC